MKGKLTVSLCALLLSACSSPSYHYQREDNPQSWQGKNISAVQKQWGAADQVFETRSGNTYYVYTTSAGRNFFDSTTTNFALEENGADFPLRGQAGLKCSAIFKTNAKNIVIATSHMGSNCGGEWAPGPGK